MTAPPDEVAPLVPVFITGISRTTYRAYPITDHIADKVCAMIEIHHRSDGQSQPSSRYHDLTDLATFARTTVVDAHELTRALRSEADRRGLHLPAGSPSRIPPGARAMREWHETTRVSPIVTSPKHSEPQLRSLTQLWL